MLKVAERSAHKQHQHPQPELKIDENQDFFTSSESNYLEHSKPWSLIDIVSSEITETVLADTGKILAQIITYSMFKKLPEQEECLEHKILDYYYST